jgi:hypothetical protein
MRLHGGSRDVHAHTLLSARGRSAVEAELDASVALLNLCQRAIDVVASAKQHVCAAQRSVRRGNAVLARAAVQRYVHGGLAVWGASLLAQLQRRSPARSVYLPSFRPSAKRKGQGQKRKKNSPNSSDDILAGGLRFVMAIWRSSVTGWQIVETHIP